MYRVLLVEDEEIELETLRDYIDWKKNGISRVFTARNGRRALECLEENMADIVITDIQMPGMSGIELAETSVRRGYPCKIVFLTGYDDFSYIHSYFFTPLYQLLCCNNIIIVTHFFYIKKLSCIT